MPPPKVILKFAALTIFLGAVLLIEWWSGPVRAYGAFFRGLGNIAFSTQFWFWPDAYVRFLDPENIQPADLPPGVNVPPGTKLQDIRILDTLLVLNNRKTRTDFGFLRTSSRLNGYTPVAFFVALALATPGRWRKRLKGLGWGLLLVHLFILLRLTVYLAEGYCGDKPFALFHPGPTSFRILKAVSGTLHDNPTVSYVVPTFIWFLLLFRPSQWQPKNETPKTDHREKSGTSPPPRGHPLASAK